MYSGAYVADCETLKDDFTRKLRVTLQIQIQIIFIIFCQKNLLKNKPMSFAKGYARV